MESDRQVEKKKLEADAKEEVDELKKRSKNVKAEDLV